MGVRIVCAGLLATGFSLASLAAELPALQPVVEAEEEVYRYEPAGNGELPVQGRGHSRIPCFFIGVEERIVALGAEMDGAVRAPHVRRITFEAAAHGRHVAVTGTAKFAFAVLAPPDRRIMEVVAPLHGGFS